MRFGLFGGARTEIGEQASDSRIYTDYIDYICEAEALGFHSVFLVEHHFTWCCRGTTRPCLPSKRRRWTFCPTGVSISASAKAIAGVSSTASACRWMRLKSATTRQLNSCA